MYTRSFIVSVLCIMVTYLNASEKIKHPNAWEKPLFSTTQAYEISDSDEDFNELDPENDLNYSPLNSFNTAIPINDQIAIHIAMEEGYTWDTIVKSRLDIAKINPHMTAILDEPINGMTPLSHAVQSPKLYWYAKLLLKAGADPECLSCQDGDYPLELAATERAKKLLLKYSARKYNSSIK